MKQSQEAGSEAVDQQHQENLSASQMPLYAVNVKPPITDGSPIDIPSDDPCKLRWANRPARTICWVKQAYSLDASVVESQWASWLTYQPFATAIDEDGGDESLYAALFKLGGHRPTLAEQVLLALRHLRLALRRRWPTLLYAAATIMRLIAYQDETDPGVKAEIGLARNMLRPVDDALFKTQKAHLARLEDAYVRGLYRRSDEDS